MSHPLSSPMCHRIDRTIRALCLIIEDRMNALPTHHWREYDLRKELVGCILGSQVRHEMAVASTENLEQAGLLDDNWWSSRQDDDFGSLVFDVLSGQRQEGRHGTSHRFPRARATQLTRTRDALVQVPLVARLSNSQAPGQLRRSLAAAIPGLGPKQASMFLRNIGRSYNLAILDTHVLRFLDMQELLPKEQARINTLSGYERVEQVVNDYAHTLGYPVGYLDWAIWATMKAARELCL